MKQDVPSEIINGNITFSEIQKFAVKITADHFSFAPLYQELKNILFSFSTIENVQLWLVALTSEFIGELQVECRKQPPVGTCSKKGLSFIRCRSCEITKCHGFLYPVICMACYIPQDHIGCDISEIKQTGSVYCDAGNRNLFKKEVVCINQDIF